MSKTEFQLAFDGPAMRSGTMEVGDLAASLLDEDFKQQLDAREIGFYKGDTLRVILATTQDAVSEGHKLHTTYEIEKVLDHIHAPKQQKLIE